MTGHLDGTPFLNKDASDNCSYSENGIKKNWTEEWCNRNPVKCVEYDCAHSKLFNCDLKAKADICYIYFPFPSPYHFHIW